MDLEELFRYILDSSNSNEERAEDINYILENIETLREYWNEYCEENGICSECGSERLTKIINKEVSEYQGVKVEEDISEYKCLDCGSRINE